MYWSSMYESSRYKFESKLGSVQFTGLVCMKVVGINLKVSWAVYNVWSSMYESSRSYFKVSWAVYNVLV